MTWHARTRTIHHTTNVELPPRWRRIYSCRSRHRIDEGAEQNTHPKRGLAHSHVNFFPLGDRHQAWHGLPLGFLRLHPGRQQASHTSAHATMWVTRSMRAPFNGRLVAKPRHASGAGGGHKASKGGTCWRRVSFCWASSWSASELCVHWSQLYSRSDTRKSRIKVWKAALSAYK